MAAATLMNPASAYHHNPPFSPYHQTPPPPSMPGMISPGGSRRASDETESAPRHSLPSISEVFSAAKPSQYTPTTPTTLGGSQTLPHPFSSAAPPRPEPAPEPRLVRPHEDKFYRYPPHPDAGAAQGPPNSYPFPEQRDPAKAPESAPNTSHANPPPPHMPYPPGQLPLSAAPVSPRHLGHLPTFDPQRPPVHADEEYGMHRNRYDSTLSRHFEAWGYQELLGKQISWNSRTIFAFADAYGKLASEQHGGQTIPERLPSEREVSAMLDNAIWLRQSLENIRDIVQQSIATEKAREGGRSKGPFDGDDDMGMYGDGMKQPYGLGEVKKRRGRAAPPGRCHSCNRIDTPEWRRGPDGARTLCNACGLHYAKLERKRQMEQRNIRPKAVEERV
ncbi:Uu.00g097740.m01.CDS01 [Anthostomella pinea]|uniref:Uu.00g097740.m01.CDS01 n=1 Tax=Anthostomella pinea TaxID=933095 RepID=A0AAI8YF20_9PEZI|nr:Uu.00g097740.m01.CDS01 [Anthostomella pinea]